MDLRDHGALAAAHRHRAHRAGPEVEHPHPAGDRLVPGVRSDPGVGVGQLPSVRGQRQAQLVAGHVVGHELVVAREVRQVHQVVGPVGGADDHRQPVAHDVGRRSPAHGDVGRHLLAHPGTVVVPVGHPRRNRPDVAGHGRRFAVGDGGHVPVGQHAREPREERARREHGTDPDHPVAGARPPCPAPRARVDVRHGRGLAEAVELLAELLGAHAGSPISSASSGDSTRSRPSAWRVIDLTVPAPIPRTSAACTSVRSSK